MIRAVFSCAYSCFMAQHEQSDSSGEAVRIDGEHETPHGWLYTFSVEWSNGAQSDHELTMSWVDHEHLVGGSVTPSAVARCSAELATRHFGAGSLPARFDVSSLRRMISAFDEQIRSRC